MLCSISIELQGRIVMVDLPLRGFGDLKKLNIFEVMIILCLIHQLMLFWKRNLQDIIGPQISPFFINI